MDTLHFKVQLPAEPGGPNDIVGGQLDVTVNGNALPSIATAKGQTEVAGLSGPQDANVHLAFRYKDDAGNLSDPSEADVVLADTFAPPAPGALGILVTGETFGDSSAGSESA